MIHLAGCGETPTITTEQRESSEGAVTTSPLFGFGAESTVRFIGVEAPPQRLEVTCVVPNRMRWWFGTTDAATVNRRMRHRSGSDLYGTELSQKASFEFPLGAERDLALLQLELRRAAFTWPEGFDWSERNEGTRSVKIEAGRLEVALGEDGRPVEMSSFDASGALQESITKLEWAERSGRWYPSEFTLEFRGTPVWNEEVVRFEPHYRKRFVDSYFLPADRRASKRRATPALEETTHFDLAPRHEMRIPLQAGTDWASALQFAANRLRDRSDTDTTPLRDGYTFELDATASPRALILIAAEETTTEEGFGPSPGGPCISQLFGSLTALSAGKVEALAKRVPEESRAGMAYAHVASDRPLEAPAQLYLRIAPR